METKATMSFSRKTMAIYALLCTSQMLPQNSSAYRTLPVEMFLSFDHVAFVS